jgi:hypothetical protein
MKDGMLWLGLAAAGGTLVVGMHALAQSRQQHRPRRRSTAVDYSPSPVVNDASNELHVVVEEMQRKYAPQREYGMKPVQSKDHE